MNEKNKFCKKLGQFWENQKQQKVCSPPSPRIFTPRRAFAWTFYVITNRWMKIYLNLEVSLIYLWHIYTNKSGFFLLPFRQMLHGGLFLPEFGFLPAQIDTMASQSGKTIDFVSLCLSPTHALIDCCHCISNCSLGRVKVIYNLRVDYDVMGIILP